MMRVSKKRNVAQNKRRLTQRALDGWYAPRFLGFSLSYERFPFPNLFLASRQ
jgi:hypothetical protein